MDVCADHSRVLFQAADSGQSGLVELLLGKGADVNGRGPVDAVGGLDHGTTALIGAIDAWGWARDEQRMLKTGEMSGPDLNDARAEEDRARQTVDLLLAHGANVNLADAQGETPLMHCVGSGLSPLANTLLDRGARIDATDPAGRTVLFKAAAEDDRALAALLLGRKANVNHRDKTGLTALMLAIDDGSNSAYRAERTWDGEPMINTPARNPPSVPRSDLPNPDGHPAMVRLLLRHGADVHAVSQDGRTAMSLAQKGGFAQVVALLKQAGGR